jgi:hypothetical protein
MGSRLTLAALGLFWGGMTFLLWWAEYGPARFRGTPVPAALVAQRVLTSPDSSSLAIIHRGQRIGFIHVIATVAGQSENLRPPRPPDGMVRKVAWYQIDFTGSLHPPDTDLRLRFSGRLTLTPEQEWKAFHLEAVSRPTTLELAADEDEGWFRIVLDSPDLKFQRNLTMADLQSPEALLRELLGPASFILPGRLSATSTEFASLPALGLGLNWTATTDHFQFQHTSVPVFRLEARLFESYSAVLIISRAGEILKVQLPGDTVLVNDALSAP